VKILIIWSQLLVTKCTPRVVYWCHR